MEMFLENWIFLYNFLRRTLEKSPDFGYSCDMKSGTRDGAKAGPKVTAASAGWSVKCDGHHWPSMAGISVRINKKKNNFEILI